MSKSKENKSIMKFNYNIKNLCKSSKNVITTGFFEFDRYLKNMPIKGSILTLGARPSMGKTSFALSICNNLLKEGYKVLYVTLDLSKTEAEKRFIENKLKLHINNDTEISFINKAIEYYNQTELYIYSDSSLEVKKLEEVIQEIKPDFVFIDYIQLLKLPKGSNLTEVANSAICEIKRIAQLYNLCVFILSQISGNPEYLNDKRPFLSDIKDYNILEDISDVIAMIYRDDYYNLDEKNNIAEIIIRKNKFGETDYFNLEFKQGFFRSLHC